MDLLTGNVKKLYFRYLGAAFGSAIISSIYGLVDTAMVGQYHGPQGAAAISAYFSAARMRPHLPAPKLAERMGWAAWPTL